MLHRPVEIAVVSGRYRPIVAHGFPTEPLSQGMSSEMPNLVVYVCILQRTLRHVTCKRRHFVKRHTFQGIEDRRHRIVIGDVLSLANCWPENVVPPLSFIWQRRFLYC